MFKLKGAIQNHELNKHNKTCKYCNPFSTRSYNT